MAVEIFNTTDLANLNVVPEIKAPSLNRSKLRFHHFHLPATTIVGDAGSSVNLLRLPAGACRVFLAESRIYWSALGAARLMDIGHRAYKDTNGNIVAAAPALFDDDVDVSAAGNAALGSDFVLAGFLAKTNRFLSAEGVVLNLTIAGGTIPIGAIFEGQIAYSEI